MIEHAQGSLPAGGADHTVAFLLELNLHDAAQALIVVNDQNALFAHQFSPEQLCDDMRSKEHIDTIGKWIATRGGAMA
jgi:hypothetical protein